LCSRAGLGRMELRTDRGVCLPSNMGNLAEKKKHRFYQTGENKRVPAVLLIGGRNGDPHAV